jgi:hypothetical protein
MPKQRLFLTMLVIMALGLATSASAATNLRKLARSPFYAPGVTSAADLTKLVNERTAELEAGFAKAGNPDLYPAFMQQFPAATIDTVKVAPGETFTWMLFKRKKSGRVAVLKQVTWKGAAPFDAYSFHIDKDGKRYEFIVPAICGNVTLNYIAPIPPAPARALAPAPPPAAPVAAPAPPPAAAPKAAAAPQAPTPAPPAPVAAPAAPPAAAAPKMVAAPPPAAPAPAPAPKPAPAPAALAAKPHGGWLADIGYAHQPDPANYVFLRAGYEFPLVDRLYLMGLVGGYLRFDGENGGSAFTADALLNYHWASRLSFGVGAGYWSGNDGQLDLIANLGVLAFGPPEGGNGTIFLEARLPADDLSDDDGFARYGIGLRYRF